LRKPTLTVGATIARSSVFSASVFSVSILMPRRAQRRQVRHCASRPSVQRLKPRRPVEATLARRRCQQVAKPLLEIDNSTTALPRDCIVVVSLPLMMDTPPSRPPVHADFGIGGGVDLPLLLNRRGSRGVHPGDQNQILRSSRSTPAAPSALRCSMNSPRCAWISLARAHAHSRSSIGCGIGGFSSASPRRRNRCPIT
jgi:hypothetical protein